MAGGEFHGISNPQIQAHTHAHTKEKRREEEEAGGKEQEWELGEGKTSNFVHTPVKPVLFFFVDRV